MIRILNFSLKMSLCLTLLVGIGGWYEFSKPWCAANKGLFDPWLIGFFCGFDFRDGAFSDLCVYAINLVIGIGWSLFLIVHEHAHGGGLLFFGMFYPFAMRAAHIIEYSTLKWWIYGIMNKIIFIINNHLYITFFRWIN